MKQETIRSLVEVIGAAAIIASLVLVAIQLSSGTGLALVQLEGLQRDRFPWRKLWRADKKEPLR